ncbi:engD, partial [Symbiodinium microadriaticum]
TWFNHMGPAPDYIIDEEWMDRVEEVANYAFDNDMYVIINIHHDDLMDNQQGSWLVTTYERQDEVADQIEKVWTQIANRFIDYGDYLIFETMNEPREVGSPNEWNGGTQEHRDVVNVLNQAAVDAIRATGGNNESRFIMIPQATASPQAAMTDLVIPNEDPNIIVSVHYYSPYNFCLADPGVAIWGTDQEKATLRADIRAVSDHFVKNGRAVVLGEWGAFDKENLDDRREYYDELVRACREGGITPIAWIYSLDRNNLTWKYPELENEILDAYDSDSPVMGGFDVVVIGNHEFDYGLDVLNDRINQSQFDWICANVDTELSELSQPEPFVSMEVGDLRVTFLGLVETNGQPGAVIPATHPWRVADVSFQRYQDMVAEYSNLKEQEGADVLVALTHLGLWDDQLLAANFPFFDLIIGGHSNHLSDESINGIPTLMAGVNLSHLGRVDLVINEGEVTVSDIHMIDLNAYEAYDEELMNVIEEYQNDESFQEVIGTATSYHGRDELGCFYTEALATYMDVDVSFQNGGGIRADLDAGDITTFEIYSIDPFNNGSVIFTKSVREIKDLFIENNLGLHVHGVNMRRVNRDIVMTNLEGNELADEMMLTLGINDYLPAVYPDYFELEDADIQDLTTAETLIEYLRTIEPAVSYEGCDHYFRY